MGATKVCFKCGAAKEVDEFYRHPAMADGRLGKCKSCTKKDVTENRNRSIDRVREYDRMRYRRDGADHRGTNRWQEQNPDGIRASRRRWAEKHKERVSASRAVNNAVRDGRLKKGPCSVCGETEFVHGHHDDYSMPLSVVWLCPKHHAAVHFEKREAERAEKAKGDRP